MILNKLFINLAMISIITVEEKVEL